MNTAADHYQSPWWLFNRHAETIYPALFRSVALAPYQRERMATPDDDFLDLDWIRNDAEKLVILSHGLEGNSTRPYMKGMARAFATAGYDVLAWNYRGCSEEMNRQTRFYHSGATDDLHTVVQHAQRKGYRKIYLIGFSLGGNLTLKYLGEQSAALPEPVRGAVAISVPLDLHGSCVQISQPGNAVYAKRFLRSLKEKILRKAKSNKALSTRGLNKIQTLIDFDNRYTSVLHGFRDALDYYEQCSSMHFIGHIQRPVLLLNAKNDPFLSTKCYPASANSFLTVRYPERGGHVGFALFNRTGLYWSELQSLQFIDNLTG
ncbi:MAG: YheT family hydrolase [Bacteroidota bacterium]